MTHFWLRDECKKNEQRVSLTPSDAKKLLEAGNKISVEKSKTRVFPDKDYSDIGCIMVESHSWPNAPKDAFILGLKELPLYKEIKGIPDKLTHKHIYFAHCFKGQSDWKEVLGRFVSGNGLVLDLEFLTFDNKRRVAAFGGSAGFAGMAVGLLVWIHNEVNKVKGEKKVFQKLKPFSTGKKLTDYIKQKFSELKDLQKEKFKYPTVLVLGALGRCGKGSVKVCTEVGIKPVEWDLAETKVGGPFKQLINYDILVNDIYLMGKIKPFLTKEIVSQKDRRLSVFVDVSCDTTNPNNPFPFYDQPTDFDVPVSSLNEYGSTLDVVAIDHLPTLIPRESSEVFSGYLLPHLLSLSNETLESDKTAEFRVWSRALELFEKKKKELELAMKK